MERKASAEAGPKSEGVRHRNGRRGHSIPLAITSPTITVSMISGQAARGLIARPTRRRATDPPSLSLYARGIRLIIEELHPLQAVGSKSVRRTRKKHRGRGRCEAPI